MKKRGNELDFICQINRDGSGVSSISDSYRELLVKEDGFFNDFKLSRLSITEDTWIASGFNSFVVKLKHPPHPLTPNK
jgi:hypothetical protein